MLFVPDLLDESFLTNTVGVVGEVASLLLQHLSSKQCTQVGQLQTLLTDEAYDKIDNDDRLAPAVRQLKLYVFVGALPPLGAVFTVVLCFFMLQKLL